MERKSGIIRLENKDLENTYTSLNQKVLKLAAKDLLKLTPKLAERLEKCEIYPNEKKFINSVYIFIYAFKNSGLPLQSMHQKLYKE